MFTLWPMVQDDALEGRASDHVRREEMPGGPQAGVGSAVEGREFRLGRATATESEKVGPGLWVLGEIQGEESGVCGAQSSTNAGANAGATWGGKANTGDPGGSGGIPAGAQKPVFGRCLQNRMWRRSPIDGEGVDGRRCLQNRRWRGGSRRSGGLPGDAGIVCKTGGSGQGAEKEGRKGVL